jgi:DhnA family fructose-bisphosphate aldolase class Ia
VKDSHATSAVAAGKTRRLRRIVKADGRACLVAIDHAAYMGGGPSLDAMPAIAAGRPDAILATWHLARAHADTFADCGLVLRVDGGTSELGDPSASDLSSLLHRAEEALSIGADAVVVLVFPGAPDEDRSLHRLARLASECELLGLPVVAEAIPGGWARAVEWDTANVARAARIAVELGADVVKTVCPGPPEELGAVVDACPAPVVVLGGPRTDSEDDVVALARGVVRAGAAGIAFGRNVWGSPDPTALVARLREAVHGDAFA